MKHDVKEKAVRVLMALLLSLGWALPLLRALGLHAFVVLGMSAAVLTLALCSLTFVYRAFRVVVSGGAAALACIFLVFGGAEDVLECARALMLHLTGVTWALPLAARQAAVFLPLLCALFAWWLTGPGAGGAPALGVTLLVMAALWLGDCERELPWTLPASAACLTMMAAASHEEGAPFARILPWMAGVALFACLLTPHGGVTVEPLKETADALRQRIYDYLFFTQPRNVFSLATEGYYPQGLSQLGGAANPSQEDVMTVQTPRRVYLRGVVKDTYNGHTWQDTTGGPRYLWVSPARRTARNEIFDALLPPQVYLESAVLPTAQVNVTMLRESASTLFVPQRVRTLSPGGDLVPYFNLASEIFITRDLQIGDTYTVTAMLCVGGDAGLETIVNACAAYADENDYEKVCAAYCALPEHMQQEVVRLAWQAGGAAGTPYARALAIQDWLQANCRYTLDVAAQPVNVDFVTNFLLNTKEGYCTYFASAMTVLCRMLGLPARYVEGYLAIPDENGVAHVTGMQGHAWTEVYFAGFGWLTFDPTPRSHDVADDPNGQSAKPEGNPPPEMPQATPTPQGQDAPGPTPTPTPAPTQTNEAQTTNALPAASPTPTPPPAPTPQKEDTEEPDMNEPDAPRRSYGGWWLWLLLLLCASARVILSHPRMREKRCQDDLERWDVWAQAVHDALLAMRLNKQTGESPMAYCARASLEKGMPEMLRDLGEVEAMIFYGRYLPGGEQVMLAQSVFDSVWQVMNHVQKVRWYFMRAWMPGKKRRYNRG